MNNPCDECAFSKQGAGLEPYNALRAKVCALGPLPFGCHHGLDWQSSKLWTFTEQRENLRRSGMCEGWRREVRELNAKGWFKTPYQVIRQAIAKQALQLIEIFVREENPVEKRKQRRLLSKMLRFLTSKDVGNKKLPLLYG